MNANDPVPSRYHPRVEAGFMVSLTHAGKTFTMRAEDLSMAGLRIIGRLNKGDDRVKVSIPLPGDRQVTALATVRRRDSDEVALEFDQLDWDDMFALARYLHPRME